MDKKDYYTNCEKCGRPITYSQGHECGSCCTDEYKYSMKACIRNKQPDCTAKAVIPSITIDHASDVGNYPNCLVHAVDTNTTFYVDDNHRPIITWAGFVNIPGYDMEHNPNHYKNQIVTDTVSKTAVIYDNNGIGFVFALTDGNLQEAVNEKLDEMAEDGTLQEIITAYIQSNVSWTFDTVSDMKAATNLVANGYALTLGFHEINDGGGALYKITDTGTPNEMNIISINDGLLANLVAKGKVNVKQFGAYGDNTHNDSAVIQAVIDYGEDVYFPKATYLISSSIIITGKNHWLMDGGEAEFNYTGNSYAFRLKSIIYCTLDFGVVNALSGSCVGIFGDKWQDFSQYSNFKFTEFSALNDCFHIESNNTCWISENRLSNGRFHSGVNGFYAMQNSSNGMSHWVVHEIGVEGVTNGFNLNVGPTAPGKGITQWEIYAMRHDESQILFKARGKVEKFLIDAPERMLERKFDLDTGSHLWKIVSADRNTYIYNGVFTNHAVDVADNITWTQDFYGDLTGISIEPDYFPNVMMTDNIATVNVGFYASSQIDNVGHEIEIARGFPKPKRDVLIMGTNFNRNEAGPRFRLYTDGVLKTYWSRDKKIYASGEPCMLSFSYPIVDMYL